MNPHKGLPTYCLILIYLPIGIALSFLTEAGAVSKADTPRCDPIGRIISGSGNNFSEGAIICRGQQLETRPNHTVQFLCFSSRETVRLPGGQTITADQRICSTDAMTRRCGQGGNEGLCFNPRGGDENTAFQIIQPTSNATVESRPTIQWTPVASADRYVVRVLGAQVSWESVVIGTHLAYPEQQSELRSGNAYRIVIVAQQGSSTLATTERTINIVPSTVGVNPRR